MAEANRVNLAALNDEDLAWRAARGSTIAWGVIVGRYRDRLIFKAKSAGHQALVAEELADEALARSFTACGTYDPERPFSRWIFRVMTNVMHDWGREQKIEGRTLVHEDPKEGAWWLEEREHAVEMDEGAILGGNEDEFRDATLVEALGVLKERDRKVLVEWANESHREDWPTQSSQQRAALHRARKRLAEAYRRIAEEAARPETSHRRVSPSLS